MVLSGRSCRSRRLKACLPPPTAIDDANIDECAFAGSAGCAEFFHEEDEVLCGGESEQQPEGNDY